jgi:hypothetical protein
MDYHFVCNLSLPTKKGREEICCIMGVTVFDHCGTKIAAVVLKVSSKLFRMNVQSNNVLP